MKSVRKKRFKKTCEFHVSQIKWAKVNKNVKSKVKICGDKVLKTKEKKNASTNNHICKSHGFCTGLAS